MEIRGYLLIKSVGNALTSAIAEPLTHDLFGDVLISSSKSIIPLSNRLCICICNGFNQQIPPYFQEFHSVFISESWCGDHFSRSYINER